MIRKQRRGPALFELLHGDGSRRGETLLPEGLRIVKSDADEPEDAVAADRPPPRGGLRGMIGAQPVVQPVGESGKGDPLVALDGDRLRLTLTPVSAAVGLFAICLVFLAAFVVGQRRGDKAGFTRGFASGRESYAAGAVDAIEAARQQPPATGLVASLLEDAPARSAAGMGTMAALPGATGEGAGWVRDFTYVVAQEFAAGRDGDAQRAQVFLGERGINAEIVRLESGALQLITLQGYNHKDPAQKKMADDLLKKERAVGAEYFAAGGGYKLEGYYRTLKRDRW